MTYSPKRWNLDELLSEKEAGDLDKLIKGVERRVKKVETWRKKLKATMAAKDFQALLKDYEALQTEMTRIGAFASLRFAADTQNQAAMAMMAQFDQAAAELGNRVLFFSLWFKALDEKNAERLMKASGDMRYWLEGMRRFRPHTLSEAEEQVINLKDTTGAQALENLYETITNKFQFKLTIDGEEKSLTRDALMMHVRSGKPEVREAAYKALYQVYGEQGPVLAQIYGSIVRDWRNEGLQLRKYKSPIAIRNLANDLPDPVVETLLDVIEENAGVFQRYFRLKAKWIGSESGQLRRYDLYAPLAPSDKPYPYDQAVSYVVDTFTRFSPRVGELAQQVFDADHVDAEVRHGKRSGAFCASTLPTLSPWVLLNYNNRAHDVTTMAHEMGHAIHALLAGEHSIMTFHSALPLAETASTFSEMLLTERLLAEETDPAVRRDLLASTIDDAYATIGRQGYFALWEKEAHDLIAQGKTPDEISARYLEVLKQQFGAAVDVSDDFKWEWVAIPHFVSVPFYVYAYAFGQLLVLALYEMYKREGEPFKAKYLKILTYGGSKAPADILKEAGINIKSAKFWQGGFDAIARMIDDLEKMETAPGAA
jgi:oligoendopeptidase F